MPYETVEMIFADRARLRAEVDLTTMRAGSLTAEVKAQRQQISALVAEVERLTRERDEARGHVEALQDQFDRAIRIGEQFKSERDSFRRAALEEAARIVESRCKQMCFAANEVASAIRAPPTLRGGSA